MNLTSTDTSKEELRAQASVLNADREQAVERLVQLALEPRCACGKPASRLRTYGIFRDHLDEDGNTVGESMHSYYGCPDCEMTFPCDCGLTHKLPAFVIAKKTNALTCGRCTESNFLPDENGLARCTNCGLPQKYAVCGCGHGTQAHMAHGGCQAWTNTGQPCPCEKRAAK